MTLTLRFDQNRPDMNLWTVREGIWHPGSLETYSRNNLTCDGQGRLVITAQPDSTTPGRPYSSGRIDSRGKFTVAPGCYLEAECVLPTAPGCWPAFWTEGDNALPNPACGEIDVVEGIGGTAYRNFHGVNAAGQHFEWGWSALHAATQITPGPHRYGVHFDANGITFFLDRQIAFNVSRIAAEGRGMVWPFDQPQFVLINLAIGGIAGTPGDVWPQAMTVGPISVYPPGVNIGSLP